MENSKILIAGCGILQKEIRFLNKDNHWNLDLQFVDSALHCDFNRLSKSLKSIISTNSSSNLIIFYGACHPLMDIILEESKIIRTAGQNCIEMLIGEELFNKELINGAFFLVEDWADRWDYLLSKSFQNCHPDVIKEIFTSDRKYFLAIRTQCSGDFRLKAEEIAHNMGVPLHWMDVTLDHFKKVIQNSIQQKQEEVNGKYIQIKSAITKTCCK